MSLDFLYEYLPSFYKNYFVDQNGNSLIEPLFNLLEMLYGDTTYQAIQIRQMVNFAKCPFLIHETNVCIDVRVSNKYLNGYRVDDEIIWLDNIYLDAAGTSSVQSAVLNYDSANKVKYVVFTSGFQGFIQSYLFCKGCYKDKKILNRVYGALLNYDIDVLQPNSRSDSHSIVSIDLNNVMIAYINYRQQLLALLYGLMMGPTIKVMNNAISLWLLRAFSPVDGVIRDLQTTSVTIQSAIDQSLIVVTTLQTSSSLVIGQTINKYDSLDQPIFKLYDMFSDPARFTQTLLASPDATSGNAAKALYDLLGVNFTNNEKDAYLFWDANGIDWDNNNLTWDMGNETNRPGADGSQSIIELPTTGLVTSFTSWSDIRFNSQMIYEMFRNLFILEIDDDGDSPDYIAGLVNFINRIKPTHTKFLYVSTASTTPLEITNPYYITEDLSSATSDNSIYHLLGDNSAINVWNPSTNSDTLFLATPSGLSNGNIIVTTSHIYLYGIVSGAFSVWKFPISGGTSWASIELPTDNSPEVFGGYPGFTVDQNDNMYLLGGTNSSFAYWYQPSGDSWTSKVVVYSGGEGSGSPRPGFVWLGSNLIIRDFYAGHNYLYQEGTFITLPVFSDGSNVTGFFSVTGLANDIWILDAGHFGVWQYTGDAWDNFQTIPYVDFAFDTVNNYNCCISGGQNNLNFALLFSLTTFNASNYCLMFDGTNFIPNMVDITGLTFEYSTDTTPSYVNTLPDAWVGVPASGSGIMLPSGHILQTSTAPLS